MRTTVSGQLILICALLISQTTFLFSYSLAAADHSKDVSRTVAPGVPNAQDQRIRGKTFCVCHYMARGNCSKFKREKDCWNDPEARKIDCVFHKPQNSAGICMSVWERDCDTWITQVVETNVCAQAKKVQEQEFVDFESTELRNLFPAEQPERIWYLRIGHGHGEYYLNNQAEKLVQNHPNTKVFFVDDSGCSTFASLKPAVFEANSKLKNRYTSIFDESLRPKLGADQTVYITGNQCTAFNGGTCDGIDCHTTQAPISFAIGKKGTTAHPHPCAPDTSCVASGETGICQIGKDVVSQACCRTGLPLGRKSGSPNTWRPGVSDCKRAPDYDAIRKRFYNVPEGVLHVEHQKDLSPALEKLPEFLEFLSQGTLRQSSCPRGKTFDDAKLTRDLASAVTQLSDDIISVRKTSYLGTAGKVEALVKPGSKFDLFRTETKKRYTSGFYCED